MPVGGAVATAADLVEDDAEQPLGGMRFRAGAAVAGAEGGQVEAGDGAIDGSGEVVRGEALFDVEAGGVVVVPGGRAEAGACAVRRAWVG